MYDYIKIRVDSPSMRRRLRANPQFKFRNVTSADRNVPTGCNEVAEWRGMMLFGGITDVKYIQGSLHKLHHSGTNWQQFTFQQVCKTLDELQIAFEVPLEHLRVVNLEVGLNIHPFMEPARILGCIVLHKTKRPTQMLRGIGIAFNYSDRYRIKLYDKGYQYPEAGTCLRVEVKIRDGSIRRRIGVRNALDLKNPDVWHMAGKYLYDRLAELVFAEPFVDHIKETDQDRLILAKCKLPETWIECKPKQRQTLRNRLKGVHQRILVRSIRTNILQLVADSHLELFNAPGTDALTRAHATAQAGANTGGTCTYQVGSLQHG